MSVRCFCSLYHGDRGRRGCRAKEQGWCSLSILRQSPLSSSSWSRGCIIAQCHGAVMVSGDGLLNSDWARGGLSPCILYMYCVCVDCTVSLRRLRWITVDRQITVYHTVIDLASGFRGR